MLNKYNPEHNEYTHYVPLEDAIKLQKKLEKLKERLKETPVQRPFHRELDEPDAIYLDINDADCVKAFLEQEDGFKMDDSVNNRHASFLLLVCYFAHNNGAIKYLEEAGSSINRVDMFGYNAIMSVILNDNMEADTKLETITYLIEKGCDVNWMNCQSETALSIALGRLEVDIANLLLDKGAVIYNAG